MRIPTFHQLRTKADHLSDDIDKDQERILLTLQSFDQDKLNNFTRNINMSNIFLSY